MTGFENKIVLITGGSVGIGAATAKKFLQKGARVYVLDIQKPPIQHDGLSYIACDVRKSNEIAVAVDEIIQKEARIDILISNAGIHFSATVEETTEEDYRKVLETNFTGAFFVLKYVLPHMRQQQAGKVVLVGSDQAFIGKRSSAIYGATKAAIAQLAKSTALDYAQYGICVNCVCPGTIETPLYRNAIEKYAKKTNITISEIEQEENALQPVGRVGNPEEVANLICFLCGAETDFITGAAYPIDGGYTAQ